MTRDFFNNFIRNLFSSIDYFIYSSIEWIVQGIFDIVDLRTNINIINDVRNKIYILLGIMMLFKITASLVSYLINPDQMNDKEKGVTKLIGRVFVMLVFLLILPAGFKLLYRVQKAFLPMVPRIILGQTNTEEIDKNIAKSSNEMAVMVLQAFFHPYYDDNGVAVDGAKEIESLSDFTQHVNDGNGMSIPLLGKVAGYSYEYRFLLSTIVGIVILVMLIGISVDLAVRLFKMTLLEMLAPIPIISYIDPKAKKDGAFNSWTKELIKTFLDIFIKLGMIYLVLFFISELQNDTLFVTYGKAEGLDVNPVRKMYLIVFIIIGLLFFLKQAPKFIKGMLGIKDNKDGGSFLGNVMGGLTGFGMGAVSGAISGHGLRGALTGAVTGAAAGYQGAASGKGSNAWQAGGDAAIKARLGDKDAKSGLAASIQRSVSSAQMKAEARRLNLTKSTIDAAKKNWVQAQEAEVTAEWHYKEMLANPTAYTDAERSAAYSDWQTKKSQSGEAERNYQKGKDAYEKAYHQDESVHSRYANGVVHRAKKSISSKVQEISTNVADGITTSVGGSTIAQRQADRTARRTSNGGFDPNRR